MSDSKDLAKEPAVTKNTAKQVSNKQAVIVSEESVVEVASKHSLKDVILWIIAIFSLIASTLISAYLPKYWAPASNPLTQFAITVGLVILALISLYFTHQGRAFKILLKDAGIELRRVTWPSKNETFRYTWQVIVVMIIVGILIWLLDNLFNYLLGFILQ